MNTIDRLQAMGISEDVPDCDWPDPVATRGDDERLIDDD